MKMKFLHKYSTIFGLFITILLGVVTGSGWTFLNSKFAKQTFLDSNSAKEIVIRVEKQTNSPLLIQSSTLVSRNPLKPTYNYFVTNVSSKTIRAYAIRTDVVLGNDGTLSGITLSNPTSKKHFLLPNIIKLESGGEGTTYSSPVTEIVLSVDFVEFDDETTWGKDYYKSSEILAGQRAGSEAVIKYFRNKLNSGNIEGFLTQIEEFNEKLLENTNSSEMFNKGYKTGVKLIINRLKKAKKESGLEGVRKELDSYNLKGGIKNDSDYSFISNSNYFVYRIFFPY